MSVEIAIDGRKVVASGTMVLSPQERSVTFKAGDDLFTLHIAHDGLVPSWPEESQEVEFQNAAINVDGTAMHSMGMAGTHSLHATLKHAIDSGANFYLLHFTIKGPKSD